MLKSDNLQEKFLSNPSDQDAQTNRAPADPIFCEKNGVVQNLSECLKEHDKESHSNEATLEATKVLNEEHFSSPRNCNPPIDARQEYNLVESIEQVYISAFPQTASHEPPSRIQETMYMTSPFLFRRFNSARQINFVRAKKDMQLYNQLRHCARQSIEDLLIPVIIVKNSHFFASSHEGSPTLQPSMTSNRDILSSTSSPIDPLSLSKTIPLDTVFRHFQLDSDKLNEDSPCCCNVNPEKKTEKSVNLTAIRKTASLRGAAHSKSSFFEHQEVSHASSKGMTDIHATNPLSRSCRSPSLFSSETFPIVHANHAGLQILGCATHQDFVCSDFGANFRCYIPVAADRPCGKRGRDSFSRDDSEGGVAVGATESQVNSGVATIRTLPHFDNCTTASSNSVRTFPPPDDLKRSDCSKYEVTQLSELFRAGTECYLGLHNIHDSSNYTCFAISIDQVNLCKPENATTLLGKNTNDVNETKSTDFFLETGANMSGVDMINTNALLANIKCRSSQKDRFEFPDEYSCDGNADEPYLMIFFLSKTFPSGSIEIHANRSDEVADKALSIPMHLKSSALNTKRQSNTEPFLFKCRTDPTTPVIAINKPITTGILSPSRTSLSEDRVDPPTSVLPSFAHQALRSIKSDPTFLARASLSVHSLKGSMHTERRSGVGTETELNTSEMVEKPKNKNLKEGSPTKSQIRFQIARKTHQTNAYRPFRQLYMPISKDFPGSNNAGRSKLSLSTILSREINPASSKEHNLLNQGHPFQEKTSRRDSHGRRLSETQQQHWHVPDPFLSKRKMSQVGSRNLSIFSHLEGSTEAMHTVTEIRSKEIGTDHPDMLVDGNSSIDALAKSPVQKGKRTSRLRRMVHAKAPKFAADGSNLSLDSSSVTQQAKDQIKITEPLNQGARSHRNDPVRDHYTNTDTLKTWKVFGVVESAGKNTSAAHTASKTVRPASSETRFSPFSLSGRKEEALHGPTSGCQTPSLTPNNWRNNTGHTYLHPDNGCNEWDKLRRNSESFQGSNMRPSTNNKDVTTRTSSTAFSPDSSNLKFVSFSTFPDVPTGDSSGQQQHTPLQARSMSLSSRPAMTQRARTTDTVNVKNLRARLESLKGIATVHISKRVPEVFIMNFVSFILFLQSAQRYQRCCGAEVPVHCFANVKDTFFVIDLLPNTILEGISLDEMMEKLEAKYAQFEKKTTRNEQDFAVSEVERVSHTSFDITNSPSSDLNKASPQAESLRIGTKRQFRLINQAFHTTHLQSLVMGSASRGRDSGATSMSNGSMGMGTGLVSIALPDASLLASADGVDQDRANFNNPNVASVVISPTQSGTAEIPSPEVQAYVPLECILSQELIDLLTYCNGSLSIRRDSAAVTLSLPYITKERLALLDSVETVQLSLQKGLFTFGVSLINILTEEVEARTNFEGASLLHKPDEENHLSQNEKQSPVPKSPPGKSIKSVIGKGYEVISQGQPISPHAEMANHSLISLTEPLIINDDEKECLSEGSSGQGIQSLSSNSRNQLQHVPPRRKSSVVQFMLDDSTEDGNNIRASTTLHDSKNGSTSPISCKVASSKRKVSSAGLATAAAGASLPSVLRSENNGVIGSLPIDKNPQAECLSEFGRDSLKEKLEDQATSSSHSILLTTESPFLEKEVKADDAYDREATTKSENTDQSDSESCNISEPLRKDDSKSKGVDLLEEFELNVSAPEGLIFNRAELKSSNNDPTSSLQTNLEGVTTLISATEDREGPFHPKLACSCSILRKNSAFPCTISQSSSSSRKATKSVSFENVEMGTQGVAQRAPSLSFPSIPNDSLDESYPNMFRILGTGPSFESGKDSRGFESRRSKDLNSFKTNGLPLSSENLEERVFPHCQTSFEPSSSHVPKKHEGEGPGTKEISSHGEARLFYLVIYTTEDRPDIEEELGRYGHCCLFITTPEKMLRYIRAGMDRFDLLLVEWNDKLLTPEIKKLLLERTSHQTVVMYHLTISDDETGDCDSESKDSKHRGGGATCSTLPASIPASAILRSSDIASVFLNSRMQRQTLEYFFRKRLLREMLELRVIQPYQIVRQIGSGSAGDVFEVVLYASKGRLAMKRIFLKNMSLRGIERLSREVHIMSSLDHPNIITFSHTCSAGNDFCIFMELCDGNLNQRIQAPVSPSHGVPSNSSFPSSHIQVPRTWSSSIVTNSKNGMIAPTSVASLTSISPEEAVLIIHDIASAIAYLHNQGIVHRDIKPANILFANNVVKIGDFGSAIRLHERRPLTNMKGTLSYMAPEVILGEPYGKPCDMWSFGCVLADIMGLDLAHLVGMHIPALVELYGSLSMNESLPVTIANLTVSRLEDVAPATTSRGVLEAVRKASIQATKERDELGSWFASTNTLEVTPVKSPFICRPDSQSDLQGLNITSTVVSRDFSQSRGQKTSLYLDTSNGGGVDSMTRSGSVPLRLPATLPVEDLNDVPLVSRYARMPYEFSSSLDKRQPHQPSKSRIDAAGESSSLTVSRKVTCININKNSVISTQMVSLPRSLVELLESLFHRDPTKRMTIEVVLEHPVSWDVEWMANMMTALHEVNKSIISLNNAESNIGDSSICYSKTGRFARGVRSQRAAGMGPRGNGFEEKLSLSLNSSPLFVPDDGGAQKL